MSEPLPPPPPMPPPPPGPPYGAPPGAPSNKGLMLVLSYLGILAIVPLIVEKDDANVQWHAKHGLVLCVAEIILFVGVAIFNMILGTVLGPFACFVGLLIPLLALGILVLHVMMIVKALDGKRLLIPGVSDFANRF